MAVMDVVMNKSVEHASHCSIWMPAIMSCDCGAIKISVPEPVCTWTFRPWRYPESIRDYAIWNTSCGKQWKSREELNMQFCGYCGLKMEKN